MSSRSGSRSRAGARVRRGAAAETLCALALWLDGWDILGRRVRFGRGVDAGEIDIIARKEDVLAFVEVKARQSDAALAHALSPRQCRRIEYGAAAWLALHPPGPDMDVRLDVMWVCPAVDPRRDPFGLIRHLPDAWRPGHGEDSPIHRKGAS